MRIFPGAFVENKASIYLFRKSHLREETFFQTFSSHVIPCESIHTFCTLSSFMDNIKCELYVTFSNQRIVSTNVIVTDMHLYRIIMRGGNDVRSERRSHRAQIKRTPSHKRVATESEGRYRRPSALFRYNANEGPRV